MIRNRISIILAAVILILTGSCAKESGALHEDTCILPVSLSVEGEEVRTRSVLPETAAFESAINEVSVLAYDSSTGRLAAARHFSSSSFSLTLTRNAPHNLYFFANMGELSGSDPLSESDVTNMSYTIPSYDAIATRGIPMSGQKSVAAGATSAPVSLRRLMAKLFLRVDNSELTQGGASQPFENSFMHLYKVARVLYPFAPGGSAARSTSDLFTGTTDYEAVEADATVTGDLVLYVPENRQGVLLPGNTEQMDKSYSNADLSSHVQAERCTYIEFTGVKLGDVDGVAGDFTYRFYPGADATRSFDLEGGKTYRITLKLTWDGLFVVGNWMVDRTDWSDTRDIGVSLNTESSFGNEISLELPPGVTNYFYKVFYSPFGEAYSATGSPFPHKEYGWTFSFDGKTASAFNSPLSTDDEIVVRSLSSGGPYTPYGITIPLDDSFCYRNYDIVHKTLDGRHQATVHLEIVEPEISITPTEVVKGAGEYGSSHSFTVRVIGGSVPESYISAWTSNTNLYVGTFNTTAKTVTCYWKTANTSTTRRVAYLYIGGLDAAAACRVYQDGKSSFIIGGDDDGGEGDNTYD